VELESSLIASQNALAITPNAREPQQEAQARRQEEQRRSATEFPREQVVVRQGNAEAFNQAERFQNQRQSNYDQPNSRARNAINAYQSLATEQQRSELNQLLGVDTYA